MVPNHDVIISVMAKLSRGHCAALLDNYRKLYGIELSAEISNKLTPGIFQDAILALCEPPDEVWIKVMRHLLLHAPRLVLPFLTISLGQTSLVKLQLINQPYEAKYNISLADHIRGHSDILPIDKAHLLNYFSDDIHSTPAALHNLLDARHLTMYNTDNHDMIVETFNSRSLQQQQAIMRDYIQITSSGGPDLTKLPQVISDMADDIDQRIVDCLKYLLDIGFNGMYLLVYLLATQCDISMEKVKAAFMASESRTLKEVICIKTAGYFQKLLLVLIREDVHLITRYNRNA